VQVRQPAVVRLNQFAWRSSNKIQRVTPLDVQMQSKAGTTCWDVLPTLTYLLAWLGYNLITPLIHG
jgi:hypothetical protein